MLKITEQFGIKISADIAAILQKNIIKYLTQFFSVPVIWQTATGTIISIPADINTRFKILFSIFQMPKKLKIHPNSKITITTLRYFNANSFAAVSIFSSSLYLLILLNITPHLPLSSVKPDIYNLWLYYSEFFAICQ